MNFALRKFFIFKKNKETRIGEIDMTPPKKSDIVKYWAPWLMKNGFDLGEPSCWACGRWWGTKYDIKNKDASWEEIYNNWNKVRELQICHIVPKSLGGAYEPSNLFLLCRECHDLAPDTTSKEQFMNWVKKQSWIERIAYSIKNEMKNFNLDEKDYEDINKIVNSEEFKEWLKENVSLHFNQHLYGPKLKISTIFAAVIEFKKHKKLN